MNDTTPSDPTPIESAPAPIPTGAPTPDAAAHPAPGLTRRTRRRTAGLIAAATAAALVIGGGGAAAGAIVTASLMRPTSSTTAFDPSTTPDSTTTPGSTGAWEGSGSNGRQGTFGGSTGTSTTATASTADEQVGVVTILTTIGYDDTAQAAGTGMVMTSYGIILTNNHVIDGSTSVEVTVESTGETYSATVVGSDATADVAVLQLDDASGLDTVSFDTDDTTAVGDVVHSVGNAQGTGDLVTASGAVIALDQSITVGNESTGASESLGGLIEVDSDVVSGDSGGPLFDADGDVIGIITAASSGSVNIVGYAIDIDDALAVVRQIESGIETATVQIGGTPFLGVELASGASAGASAVAGVAIGGVVDGMPAQAAGLAAGDTVTSVDGVAVASSAELSAAIAAHEVGDAVTVGWTDAAGATHTADITLVAGPA